MSLQSQFANSRATTLSGFNYSQNVQRVASRCGREVVMNCECRALSACAELPGIAIWGYAFGQSSAKGSVAERDEAIALATNLQESGDETHRMFATELSYRFASWWMILRTSLEERLAYRGDFALGNADAIPADHHANFSLVGHFRFGWDRWSRIESLVGLFIPRHGGVLPAVDVGPSLFEYAGAGVECCQANSRWRRSRSSSRNRST